MRFRNPFLFFAITGLIAGTLALSACKAPAEVPRESVPEVGFATVTAQKTLLTTELPGRTSAYLVAEIRPQVNGIVQSRNFKEGAFVKEGDLLYQIDAAPYKAALDQATAALAASEADLGVAEANIPALRARAQRLKELSSTHAVAQQDSDDAAAALRQAEASLEARKAAVGVSRAGVETARVNLSYTPIRSPISGRIGISSVTVGALVTAHQGAPMAVVQQLDPIYVDVAQANADVLHLRSRFASGHLKTNGSAQSKVKLYLEDKSAYPVEGTMEFRDVSVDPTTGSVTLRLVFRNPSQILLPGMFVRAVVQEGINEAAILVPQQGVTRNVKGSPIAWIVNPQDVVEERTLELDREIGSQWLVLSGLNPGDRLIVEGLQKVRPGSKVKAVPSRIEPAAVTPQAVEPAGQSPAAPVTGREKK